MPQRVLTEHGYTVELADTAEDLDAVTRLRFEVFNLELGCGLVTSAGTGRDRDDYDDVCDHLMVRDTASGQVVGTYRVQTASMAASALGFCSAAEFDVQGLPLEVRDMAVEAGRACIDRRFRNRRVLLLLWKALACYLERHHARYLFGCCSLPVVEARAAREAELYLHDLGAWHPTWRVGANPAAEVPTECEVIQPFPELPMLFRAYLRFGALVCGGPVIDRAFGTTDFFVVLDRQRLSPEAAAMFFGRAA